MAVLLEKLTGEAIEALRGMCAGLYLDGQCYEFSIAVHRGLGWPLVGLNHRDVVRHAAVLCPNGYLFDARGMVKPDGCFGEPFGLEPPYIISYFEKESEFRKTLPRPVHTGGIRIAERMSAALWPKFPWKKETFQGRVVAYLKEIEEVSRKHKLWIRAPVPAQPPVIAEGEGDELGYVLRPTDDGITYIFERRLVA